ncbi:MAG: tetratricopeptide repeat protein [Planctomycetes bacterium]|nr:tetratricopeptide repeat protein [Planctomycetota bacterium]
MRAFLLVFVLLGVPTGDADEQYSYVAALAEKGLHERVVREAQTFLREHAEHPKADLALYRLACALFELHRAKEARPEFQTLANRRGFEFAAEVQFRLAQCLLEAGEYERAEAALERVLAAEKKEYLRVPARALFAQSALARKDHARALAAYDELLRAGAAGDSALEARCGRAWCLHRLGRAFEAAQAAQTALDAGAAGRAGEMAFLLGECRLDLKDARGALEAYRRVGTGDFADAAARGAAFALAELGEHAAAADAYGRVVERFPASVHAAECALQAGVEWLAAGDPRAAVAALSRSELGGSAEALGWRARAHEKAGDREAALATLQRALDARPDEPLRARLLLQRADLLTALGRGAEARADYERIGSDRALLAAAVQALEAKEHARAVELAARLLEQFPASELRVDALLALGEGLFGAKRYADAEEAFVAARDADREAPRRARAGARAAWSAYLAGELVRAGQRFAEAARGPEALLEVEEAAFMAGRAREDAGDAEGARAAYHRAAQRFPRGAHAEEGRLRGALLDPKGGPEALEALARDALGGPLVARVQFELAERKAAAGNHAEALANYRATLAAEADGAFAPRARYGLAWSAFQLGRFTDCAAALEALGDGTPTDLAAAARDLSVWCAVRMGELDLALEAWKALCAAEHDDERAGSALRALCAALCAKGRSGDARTAVELYAKSARSPGARSRAALEQVLLLADGGHADEAEAALAGARDVSADDPLLAEAAFRIGEARFTVGDDAKAIACYDVAAKSAFAPLAASALYKAGFTRLRAGDAAGAARSLAELVTKHPESELFHESLFLLGEARFREKQYAQAVVALERVRKEAPRHAVIPKALFRLGLAYGKQEQWKPCADALTELARVEPKFPNLAEAELWRGRALAGLADARGARAAFDRVLALDKGLLSAQAHNELGRLLFEAGDADGALSEFLKVAVLYAGDEEVCEALVLAGQVLEAQSKPDAAKDQYREAREKHPKAAYAAEAARRLAALGTR